MRLRAPAAETDRRAVIAARHAFAGIQETGGFGHVEAGGTMAASTDAAMPGLPVSVDDGQAIAIRRQRVPAPPAVNVGHAAWRAGQAGFRVRYPRVALLDR
jgi:hypothetical protein